MNPFPELRYGIEAEYLLIDAETKRPLDHGELSFETLNELLESIPVSDLPPTTGLLPLPPHRRVMPYLIEGYHIPDPDAPDCELLPKGIEIRTPVCHSIAETVAVLGELHSRLRSRLLREGMLPAALSHHPLDEGFAGPQGSRSLAGWRWAQRAMTTYGPDFNVGLPPELFAALDRADLAAKVDSYAPAMTLLSLSAPFHGGDLWRHDGQTGKSVRTFFRSSVGEVIEFHPRQPGRIEFKSFDMPSRPEEFAAYLALWTAVLLDDSLAERSDEATRREELKTAAIEGMLCEPLRRRAAEMLQQASAKLEALEIDPGLLAPLFRRIEERRLPADEWIDEFRGGLSLGEILEKLSHWNLAEAATATKPNPLPTLSK